MLVTIVYHIIIKAGLPWKHLISCTGDQMLLYQPGFYIKFVSVLGSSKISFSYIQFEGCLQNNKDLGAANIIMRESELMHVRSY